MHYSSAVAVVALSLLAMSACSSSTEEPAANPGIAEGEPNPLDPDGLSDETSMPAPELEDEPPLSSEPGGDTSVIAGYWDGTGSDGAERYFVIAPNGLWTEYFLSYEGDVAGNCYWMGQTMTLTPEDPANDAYSLANGQAFILTTDAARTALTVEYTGEERSTDIWPAVVGRVPEDLPLCQ